MIELIGVFFWFMFWAIGIGAAVLAVALGIEAVRYVVALARDSNGRHT